jgi:hypothetical protein
LVPPLKGKTRYSPRDPRITVEQDYESLRNDAAVWITTGLFECQEDHLSKLSRFGHVDRNQKGHRCANCLAILSNQGFGELMGRLERR